MPISEFRVVPKRLGTWQEKNGYNCNMMRILPRVTSYYNNMMWLLSPFLFSRVGLLCVFFSDLPTSSPLALLAYDFLSFCDNLGDFFLCPFCHFFLFFFYFCKAKTISCGKKENNFLSHRTYDIGEGIYANR